MSKLFDSILNSCISITTQSSASINFKSVVLGTLDLIEKYYKQDKLHNAKIAINALINSVAKNEECSTKLLKELNNLRKLIE